ncbi:13268_t:CDS:2 [Funneliformis geosporum]|nr:13268_t:CDS:2 [Funneliformis geosporum]
MVSAEKPDKMLAVICGAVTKAYTVAMESIMEYKQNDPTKLRLLSPGKLVKFLVESGDHVKRGDKIHMPFIATEDGIVQFIKTLVSSVRHALYFEGQLPAMNPPVLVGDKAHQRYCEVEHILEYNSDQNLMQYFKHSPVDPAKLEAALLRISNETHSQGLEYPAKRLKEMVDNYSLDFVKSSDLSSFKSVIAPYHDVEVLFSNSDKREEEASCPCFTRRIQE